MPYDAKEHSNPERPVQREALEYESESGSEKLSEGENVARRRVGQDPRIEKIRLECLADREANSLADIPHFNGQDIENLGIGSQI